MSGCIARPATSSASIRPRCRRGSHSPTTAGRSPSPMSASRRRARRRANTGTTPPAGARSSRFLKDAGYRVICIDQKRQSRHRPRLEPHPPRRRGRDRRPAAAGARALAQACRVLHRPVERPVLARLGGRHAGGDDQRLHPSDQRVRDALSRDQLSRLQQLLERPARYRFDHKDFLWCPRHKDTPRQFECTRLITVEHVRNVLRSLPNFGSAKGKQA